jgi:molybdenum cofactor cytidylyltransferase
LALPVVLVLASGRGARFQACGGTTHKLQAVLGEKTVLQHTLDAVQASGLPMHLEQGSHASMGDCITAAVRACASNAGGWLILPADLPLISPHTLRAVAQELTEHPVVVPVFQGQRGHPVGFSADCRTALLGLQGAPGAASVVRQFPTRWLEVDDIGSVTDIDTPADLERAAVLLRFS